MQQPQIEQPPAVVAVAAGECAVLGGSAVAFGLVLASAGVRPAAPPVPAQMPAASSAAAG
jgi:hypothetical protein